MYPYIYIGEKSISLYDTMYLVGIIGMFAVCLLSRKKYKTNLLRSVIYTVVTFAFGVMGAKLMSKIYVASLTAASSGEYVPDSGVCIFGALMFLPVFMIILAVLSGEKYRKLMDYMTPGIFFILACAKFGCLLGGCCYGIADENGVYNRHLDYLVFPVQLYESLCTLAVTAILAVITFKRNKKIRYGALYPIGTILYCSARIVWENFRYYEYDCEKNFFLGLTYWQCWAVTAIIISVVWLIVLYSVKSYELCPLDAENIFENFINKLSEPPKKTGNKSKKKTNKKHDSKNSNNIKSNKDKKMQ